LGVIFAFGFKKQFSMKINLTVTAAAMCIFISCRQHRDTAITPKPQSEAKTTGGKDASVSPLPSSIPQAVMNEPAADTDGGTKKDEGRFQAKDSIMPFIVSFYSIGSGIDRGQPEKLKAFADSYGKKINVQIDYLETHWGREGETDYCFPLKGLSDVQVIEFRKGVKETLKESEHVHFIENQVCRTGR
jgi:hypothetical protein